MVLDVNSLAAEELLQHVWITTSDRTPLELRLAELVSQLLGEIEDLEEAHGDDS